MKAFPQIPLLLAFSACVGSALGINPTSTSLQKRQYGRDKSGKLTGSGSTDVNAFYPDDDYNWPEPFKSNFYHSGGAQKSYIASKDDNPYFDFPPKQLNASEAAEVYPGDWPDVVYAWWFVYTNNQNRPTPEETTQFQAINCLCEAEKECGCAPVGWTTVSGFHLQYDHNAMIRSNDWNDDWIVNGTATAQEILQEQNELKAEDESGASKKLGGSGWSALTLIVVAMFSGL